MTENGTKVQSVSRAVRLLMLVAGKTTENTNVALAAAAGLAVPTSHHLLSTLVEEGLLYRDAEARYSLGPKTAVLASALEDENDVPGFLASGLLELVAATGETSYLAIWRSGAVRLVAASAGSHAVQVAVPPDGQYRHAHARASGKLFLAHLASGAVDKYFSKHPCEPLTEHTLTARVEIEQNFALIRERCYSVEEEEFQLGVCCVSAPVLSEGVIIAAFTISVPTARWVANRDRRIAETVSVASALSTASTSRPPALAVIEGSSISE